jgi:hypothetical protein
MADAAAEGQQGARIVLLLAVKQQGAIGLGGGLLGLQAQGLDHLLGRHQARGWLGCKNEASWTIQEALDLHITVSHAHAGSVGSQDGTDPRECLTPSRRLKGPFD